jgi:hypothetical protein
LSRTHYLPGLSRLLWSRAGWFDMEENVVKLSPIVAFRLGLMTEFRIAERADLNPFDKDFIFAVMQQKAKVTGQRDSLLRGLMVAFFSFFLLTYGASFQIPYLDMNLRQIPAIHEFIAGIVSLYFLLLFWNFYSDQCYAAVRDCYSDKLTKETIEPTLYSASLSEEILVFSLFNTHAQRKLGEELVISRFGQYALWFALKTLSISILLLISGSLISFCYLVYINYNSGELNVFVSFYALMNVIFTFILIAVLSMEYSYKIVQIGGNKTTINSTDVTEK